MSKIPKALQIQMDADLAGIKKRILDRDTLIAIAWLAGAEAAMGYARSVVK